MKSKLRLFSRSRVAAQGLLLGFALLTSGPAKAQNFVKNPDFEEPLGPDNWTIVYVSGGPNDFFVKGRTRLGHKDLGAPASDTWDGDPYFWNKFGLDIKAGHDWLMHAYFKQTVSGLTPLGKYTVSVWMMLDDDWGSKLRVYMETLGGASGTASQTTPYVTAFGGPSAWARYVILTNTASTSGQIEIRLHYDKFGGTDNKWRNMDALYDHVSMMPVGQTQYMPPYKILSLTRTNQDITLQWQTVMNNRYRIQYSTNLSNPTAWLERSKSVDTNFFALGTNFTFTTNLLAYNPSFNTNAPLFFRIHSTSWTP